MKKQLITLLISSLLPIFTYAQQPGLNPEQMQQLMQNAQQMQECMSRIDQNAMMAMSQRAQAMETQIKSLCQENKRDEALDTAIEFGRSIADDENVKIARECGEMVQGMLPAMEFPTDKNDVQKGRHICDDYSQ